LGEVHGLIVTGEKSSIALDRSAPARMVIIYAFYPNRPEFMPVQARCYRRFLCDDYELRIVNSATSESARADIATTAADLSLPTLNVDAPNRSLPPSHAHAHLIHEVLRNQPTPPPLQTSPCRR
jgi:hypothetical protein